MLKITLDMNCIVDLEQRNARAPRLKKLIELHSDQKISLRVVAISASERKPDGTYVSNLNEFKRRIAALGLADVEILPTLARCGIAFFDYCLFSGGALDKLEREIQTTLFPTIELEFRDFCNKRGLDLKDREAWRKWVNKKCDVLALWSHIWYHDDIFVSTDQNFHKKTKKPKLIALGAGKILRPVETVRFLTKLLKKKPKAIS